MTKCKLDKKTLDRFNAMCDKNEIRWKIFKNSVAVIISATLFYLGSVFITSFNQTYHYVNYWGQGIATALFILMIFMILTIPIGIIYKK